MRKSAVFRAATAPLSDWQRSEWERLQPIINRTQSEHKTLTGRIEHLRAKAAKVPDSQVPDIMREIEILENDLPEVPTLPRLYVDDCTPEHMATLTGENRERLSILSSEGGIFQIIGGRYSKSNTPNLQLLLQAHEGDSHVVDRGSRPGVFLSSPAITIGLTVQPDVIRSLSLTPEFRGRGLTARFLFFAPESNIGRRTLDAPPMPASVADNYAATVKAVLDHPWATDKNGNPCAHVLKLSPEAFAMWKDFSFVIEAGLAPGGQFEHISDWAGKLSAAVARLAAILHVARYAHTEPWTRPISFDDMDAAVRLAYVLSQHALTVFDCMGADAALDDARAVLAWIKREGLTEFTRRDALRCNARFRRAEELDGPLDVLTERGFVRPRPQAIKPGAGRPSRVFEVNPNDV